MIKLLDRPGSRSIRRDMITSRKVSRKYMMRRIHRREYHKLRAIVPSVCKMEKVSKVTVIEEAIKYIDELHDALMERIQAYASDMGIHGAEQMTVSQNILKSLVVTNLRPFCNISESSITLSLERHNKNASHWKKPTRKT